MSCRNRERLGESFRRVKSSPSLVTGFQSQFANFRSIVDGSGDKGGDKGQCGAESILGKFQSKFTTFVDSQENIGGAAPSALEYDFALALGHPKTMADSLEKCRDE